MFRPWDDQQPVTDTKPDLNKNPGNGKWKIRKPEFLPDSDIKQEHLVEGAGGNLDENPQQSELQKCANGGSTVYPPMCLDSLAIAYRGLPLRAR